MAHPCCGFSLRKATLLIAVLEILGAIFGALFTVACLLIVTCYPENVKRWLNKDNEQLQQLLRLLDHSLIVLGFFTFMVVICLMELALATFLIKGARHRKVKKCEMWWKIKCIVLIIAVLFIIGAVATAESRLSIGVSGILGLSYQIYTIWVVRRFIAEVRFGKPIRAPGEQEEGFHKL